MKNDILRIGNTVQWRGGFGSDSPKPAKVTTIEVCPQGEKYGKSQSRISWDKIQELGRRVVLNLDNGHWCYGTQISKK